MREHSSGGRGVRFAAPARSTVHPFARPAFLFLLLLLSPLSLPPGEAPGRDVAGRFGDKSHGAGRVWVWDGSGMHNVGNLHMHVCNWGVFGSYPGRQLPISELPSAQWPANSGVEHLYTAGLWVGARRAGIPVVSTATPFDAEFRPSTDPLQRIYKTFEGAGGGARLPSPADDDRDGLVDEDWLNGYDDDGDGRVDEDFAAVSNQMITCWYRDDDPTATQVNPDHTPLHLFVRQESYAWEEEKYWNFIGVEYRIRNDGAESIEDLYVGFFADGDVGHRDREEYWMDDRTDLWEGTVCAMQGERQIPFPVSIAYFRDDDGDEGQAPGFFGILFLGHDIDPLGENAPRTVGITSYQNFAGDLPYEEGGDPDNDAQRYELMSKGMKDRPGEVPRDYRMLLATGPFRELAPDSETILQVAFVCGNGLDGMLRAAASAALAYEGNRFNVDGDPQTGVNGRETPVYGPVSSVVPDSCSGDLAPETAARGEIIWVNVDCREEIERWIDPHCSKGRATFKDFQTGIDGKEHQVNWLVGTAPPPPGLRLIPGDRQVALLWDNFSEVTPDVSTLEHDFEGYRIWRADGWKRPIGTSILSGPSRDLWQLLEERDLVNGVGPDVGFMLPASRGGWRYEPLAGMPGRAAVMRMFAESIWYDPLGEVPCPPGLSAAECDTIEALVRYELGFEGGLQYYRYVDRDVHNGMHYFYSVTAFDHVLESGVAVALGKYGDPSSNFQYIVPLSDAQDEAEFQEDEVFVVPNPATPDAMAPWALEPNMDDPTGSKVEFRNLPACRLAVRIYTIAGDLVEVLFHDGTTGHGTLQWDLVSRNGQDVTSGVYLFAVEPENDAFGRTVGKFVVIR